MVTAETAMVLPVLVVLALAGVAAIGVAQARIRCADAAREAARSIARGDSGSSDRLARAAAGRPVSLSSGAVGGDTAVTVRVSLRPLSWLPPITVTETAVVATEPEAGSGAEPGGGGP
ncbi:MAG: pilus assembly protein [Actinomycetota bacterium]|nr:pilus assembly protein [Actinomycetota bacterium]MDQ2958112.1 pilus assembly protein [Actinomycetota bacterium]